MKKKDEESAVTVDFDDLIEADKERKRRRAQEHKEVTVRQYLDLVKADPRLCQNSPARLLEVIEGAGVEEVSESQRWLGTKKRFKLFSEELYGVDLQVAQVVDHVINGAKNASSGKYVLWLIGPTSSGKSTFTTLLKKALERYRDRPVFGIKGCPIREEPLNILPRNLTRRGWIAAEHPEGDRPIEDKLGIPAIEGDLCPVCRDTLKSKFTDADGVVRWWEVPVETFTFSIQGVRGIGSFEPAGGDIAQDVTELVGRENIAITSTKGYDHPLAFSLDGEVEKGNRGIVEGVEMPKADPKIIRVFISLAEEKKIKVQGSSFPHIHIDTVVVGHGNLMEYKKFSNDQGNAALHDRIFVVPFPYTLRVNDEVRIYRKLIERDSEFVRLSGCHIPDATYKIAAAFAVLTRLQDSAKYGVTRLLKLKAYNGEAILAEMDKDRHPVDIRALVEEFNNPDVDIEKREGMFGVSYRDVLAALNMALARQGERGCLTPLTAIRALAEVFDHRMGYSPEEIKKFREMLTSVESGSIMAEFKEFVIKTLTKAFLRAYGDLQKNIVRKYIDEARLQRSQTRRIVRRQMQEVERDKMTGRPKEPDLNFLKAMNRLMGISDSQAELAYGELLEFLESNPGEAYEPLEKAAEKKMIEDNKTNIALLLDTTRLPTEEDQRRSKDLKDALADMGFCPVCSQEICERGYEFMKA